MTELERKLVSMPGAGQGRSMSALEEKLISMPGKRQGKGEKKARATEREGRRGEGFQAGGSFGGKRGPRDRATVTAELAVRRREQEDEASGLAPITGGWGDPETVKRLQAQSDKAREIKPLLAELAGLDKAEEQALIDSGEYRSAGALESTLLSAAQGFISSQYGKESWKAAQGLENKADYWEGLLDSDTFKFIPQGLPAKAVSGAFGLGGQQVAQALDERTLKAILGGMEAGTVIGGAMGAGLGSPVTAPIGAAVGGLAGWQAGSAAANMEIEAGLAYNEMIENGITPETAKGVALAVGGINAGLELVQLDELKKSFKALVGKKATQGTAMKLAQALADYGIDVAKETAQEVAQEGVTIAGAQYANQKEKGEWAYDLDQVLSRLGETAASSALSFGASMAPGHVMNAVSNWRDGVGISVIDQAGEMETFFFNGEDQNNSWKTRTYVQGEKTFIQSEDRQRMYEVPTQGEISFTIDEKGAIILHDDIVAHLDKRDYRDFIKAYAAVNLITQVDPTTGAEINPKPIKIKSDGAQVIITQTGINDVAKKIRGAGLKNQDNVSSILLLNHIIENAKQLAVSENKHGKTTKFTDYMSRFSCGGRTYDVLLHIKNAKQGKRYHYHTLNAIEVTPVDGSNSVNAGTYQTEITSNTTLPQIENGVKGQDFQESEGAFSGQADVSAPLGLTGSGEQPTLWSTLPRFPEQAEDPLMRAALEMAESGALEGEPVIPTETMPVQPQDAAHSGAAPTEISTQATPQSTVPEGEPVGLTVRQRLTLDEMRYAGHTIKQVGMALEKMGPEAIRGVINQGLRAAPDAGSHIRAQMLQKKLDAGQDITHSELGHLYDTLRREPTRWGSTSGQSAKAAGKDSPALTAEEKGAILAYKSSESYKINAALRDGTPLDPQDQQFVNSLDSALSKLPIYRGTVYRNLGFDDFGEKADMDAFLSQFAIGKPVIMDAYTSTSKSIDGHPIDGKYVVNMEIESTMGREMAGFGNNSEKEVLLRRGAVLVPIEITIGEDGRPLIKLIEVEGF